MKHFILIFSIFISSSLIAQTTVNIHQKSGGVLKLLTSSIDSITFTVDTNTTAPGIIDVLSSPVSLFGQINGSGSNPNFLQLKDPFQSYNTNDFGANKTNVNLVFYYGASNKATFTSPTDAVMQSLYSGLNWAGTNSTQLSSTTMTGAQFDLLVDGGSDAAITALAATATWTTSVNMLTDGRVILFKTSTNKLGLIRVVSLIGMNAGDIEISMKIAVQKD